MTEENGFGNETKKLVNHAFDSLNFISFINHKTIANVSATDGAQLNENPLNKCPFIQFHTCVTAVIV